MFWCSQIWWIYRNGGLCPLRTWWAWFFVSSVRYNLAVLCLCVSVPRTITLLLFGTRVDVLLVEDIVLLHPHPPKKQCLLAFVLLTKQSHCDLRLFFFNTQNPHWFTMMYEMMECLSCYWFKVKLLQRWWCPAKNKKQFTQPPPFPPNAHSALLTANKTNKKLSHRWSYRVCVVSDLVHQRNGGSSAEVIGSRHKFIFWFWGL